MKQKSLVCEFYYPRPMTLMFENSPSIEKKFDSPLYYIAASQTSNSNNSANLKQDFDNIFGGLSGHQIELFYRKKGAEKSRDTVPLMYSYVHASDVDANSHYLLLR